MVILPSTSHLYLQSTRYHFSTDPYPSYSNISSLPSQPFTPIHLILHVSLSLYLFCNLTLPSLIYSFSSSPSSVPVQPAPVTVTLIAHTSSSTSSHSTDLNTISPSTFPFYPKFTHYSRPSYPYHFHSDPSPSSYGFPIPSNLTVSTSSSLFPTHHLLTLNLLTTILPLIHAAPTPTHPHRSHSLFFSFRLAVIALTSPFHSNSIHSHRSPHWYLLNSISSLPSSPHSPQLYHVNLTLSPSITLLFHSQSVYYHLPPYSHRSGFRFSP